jgi:hypothetical protein
VGGLLPKGGVGIGTKSVDLDLKLMLGWALLLIIPIYMFLHEDYLNNLEEYS